MSRMTGMFRASAWLKWLRTNQDRAYLGVVIVVAVVVRIAARSLRVFLACQPCRQERHKCARAAATQGGLTVDGCHVDCRWGETPVWACGPREDL